MQSTPLFQLLKALTKSDRRDLAKFLRSPFHNTREDVVRLFDFFEKNLEQNAETETEKTEKRDPSVQTPFLTKENAHRFVFTENVPFDDATMRYTMSFLLKLTKQFLIHKELIDNDLQQNLLLTRALKKRNADLDRRRDRSQSGTAQGSLQLIQSHCVNGSLHQYGQSGG